MGNLQHIKYRAGSQELELMRGEVVSINYTDEDIENHYVIGVSPINLSAGMSPSDIILAKPLDINIKRLPLLGEIVVLLKGPTAYSSAFSMQAESYYINTFSLQSNINHNSLPKVSKVNEETGTNSYDESLAGITVDSDDNDHYFSENMQDDYNISPLQPYAGDVLFEGRFGNSIRFGSTHGLSNIYSSEPKWTRGPGQDGDPIMIFANGRVRNSSIGKYINEDISNDLSSMYFTSTQKLTFERASNKLGAIERQSINSFDTEQHSFSGEQIGIFTKGRLIVNTKEKEMIFFASGGFGVSSNKSICFDTSKEFEIGNAKRINLGLGANEPALLGDTTGKWLSDLLTQLISLTTALTVETHISPVGPTTPPVNIASYVNIQSRLTVLQQKIPTLKSRLVFLNKSPK